MVNRIVALLLLIIPLSLFGQSYPDSEVHKLIETGITQIEKTKYQEAEQTFRELDKRYPKLPAGKIFIAATEIVRCFDLQIPFDEKKISRLIEEATELAETRIDENPKSAWSHYFMALALSYSAYYDYINRNWFSVLTEGYDALKSFEKCLEYDKNFYEATLAIAIFKYWKSKKTEDFHWLPFMSDESQEALKDISKYSQKYFYNTGLFINSVAWIYIDQKDFYKAKSYCDMILQEHPENRIVRWTKARCYEDIDRTKAIEEFRTLLNMYGGEKAGKVNLVMIKHRIAINYSRLGMHDKALELCNEILAVKNYNAFEKDKLEKRLERVRNLKTESEQKLKSNGK